MAEVMLNCRPNEGRRFGGPSKTLLDEAKQIYRDVSGDVLLLLLLLIQGIYNYMPETNHVTRVCNVASLIRLQYLLYVRLFSMIKVFYFYYYYYYYLSSLCRLSTVTYMKQTVSAWYIILQHSVFTMYGTCNVTAHEKRMYFYIKIILN